MNSSIKRRETIIMPGLLLLGLFSAMTPAWFSWPVIFALGGFILGALLISFTEPEDRSFLFSVFLAGFSLRLFLSMSLFFISILIGKRGFFICDGFSFNCTASWMSNMWRMGIFPDAARISENSVTNAWVTNYDYWCGFIYFLTGNNPIVLFFVNSLAGSFTIILVYLIAKQIFNIKAAEMSSLFYAFWPSLVLWSTQNLKEPITILLVTFFLWAIVGLKHRLRLRYILFLVLSFLGLMWWRAFMVPILGLAALMSFLIFFYRKGGIVRIIMVMTVFVLLTLIIFSHPLLFFGIKDKSILSFNSLDSVFDFINRARYVRTLNAGSAFFSNMDISSLPKLFLFLPIGLIFLLLAPFPWQLGSLDQILAVPEMLIWYILLPFTFRGLFFSFKRRWDESSSIILFIIFMGLVLCLTEGNVGTLFRHRAIILGLFLIFTSVGIVQAKEREIKIIP